MTGVTLRNLSWPKRNYLQSHMAHAMLHKDT
jgi:hypothetical protein